MARNQTAATTSATRAAGLRGQVILPNDHLSRAIGRSHPLPPGGRAGTPVPGSPLRHGPESARKWEFPKGGVEKGESTRQTAAREFTEETGLKNWSFVDGFERSLSYTYIRRGGKVVKTVTYYLLEVGKSALPTRSEEHVEDPHGRWFHWGTFEEINQLLYHTKIRQVFAEANNWLRK